MNVLGIIPARGGSKGVKDKNIRIIAGEYLIQYAINACMESKKLSQFVVSTDSDQIKKIVTKTNTLVVDRPSDLSSDTSPVVDAAIHALTSLENSGIYFDAVMLIQPTSPIRTGKDLDKAIEILENTSGIDGVVSVLQVEDAHPARMYLQSDNGLLTNFFPRYENTRRQDLPQVFLRNGAIYLVRREQLIEKHTFMPQKKVGMVMNSEFTVNIDNEIDVLIADVILKEWKDHTRNNEI